ncbi:MAG: PAS domain-containing sensor histidine kinase, partial [Alphaproteobacteria bacterium]|nr:PAS domain-containing sensor histidine kinase [Alphaproteobacteria bacterium]
MGTQLPQGDQKHGVMKIGTDYKVSVLVVLVATILYFVSRAQILEFVPEVAGLPLVRPSLDWPYQLLAIAIIGTIAAVFGARFGEGPRWSGPLGLVLLSIAAVSTNLYLQVNYGVALELTPAILLPALVLVFAGIRANFRSGHAVFVKEMALLHKDTLLKTVFENTYDSIFVVNDEKKIVYVNDAALGRLGYKRENLIGQVVDELCPAFEPGEAKHKVSHYLRIAKLEKAQIGPHPTTMFSASGTAIPIEVTVGAVRLARSNSSPFEKRKSDRYLYVCNFWDASVRDQLETIRRTGYEDQLIADRSMAEFVANMSHELRTPLNAIMGFSELLDSDAFGTLTEKQQEFVRDINSSANHLLKIINDILDISKVESGKAQLHEEQVNIADLAQSCIKLIEHKAEQGQVKIETRHLPKAQNLFVDKRKLKQILINLLSNAVKFTPPGGAVEIAGALEPDGSYSLMVSDTGIGLRSKDIAIALAPFGQVASGLDRKYEGTGLGLPLARSLAQAHGGDLTIKSRLKVGTTVTVSLPPSRVMAARGENDDPV